MSQPRIPASPGLRQAMEQEAAGREKKKGDDCYKEKFYQRALKHYTRGADLDPNDISFLIKRGKAYFHMHMYKECVVDCNEAVERARRLESNENLIEEALEWKGSALFNLAACAADYEQAIRSLKESLQLCPSNKETQGKLDGAESIMKNFQDLEAAQHHQDDGGELLRQGKWEEAAVQFTEAIKLNPADPKNFSDRAKCHIKLNVLAQGLEDADKCIELNRAFWKGYLRKGDIQFMMDNYEGAIATYLAGLKYGPQKTYIHDGLMRCAERIIEMAHDTGATVEKHVREKKYLRNELKKSKAEAKEFKEEATDERLRRIELDQMVKALEDSYSSRVKQLMKEHDGQLQRANKDNANLERQLSKYRKRNANLKHQLSDCREDFERLQSIQNSMQAHFKCPISQEVMNDPHVAADGHTYEAEEIRRWLHEHHTSPMTNLQLEHNKLIPNHTLRSAIQELRGHQNMAE